MKNLYIFFLALLGLILSACPSPERVLVAEYPLPDSLAQIIPYNNGDTVVMLGDSGQKILFEVSKVRAWEEKNFNYCGLVRPRQIEYIRYEYIKATLSSYYPEITINLTLYPKKLFIDSLALLKIEIGNKYYCNFYYDTAFVAIEDTELLDSITFRSQTFYNVVKGKLTNYLQDSNAVYFTELYYNKTYGIICLKMSDNEQFVVNN